MRDEYRALLEDARDALHDLLVASDPGTGLDLRRAYNQLKAQIKEADHEAAESATERQESATERHLRHAKARRQWRVTPKHERHRRVIEIIGSDRLTTREVLERLDAELPDGAVYHNDVATMLRELYRSKELDRNGDPRRGGYRYFRRSLEGPIADLERRFREGS